MTLALFYDTETTGLPLFKEPSDDPRQPHIVQLAALIVDLDSKAILASMDFICKPDGWTIPDEAAAIHGITTEKALACGVREEFVVTAFHQLCNLADFRVGHNESFDARIMRIALMRHDGVCAADRFKDHPAKCTAALSTDIVKAPPTDKMKAVGRNHYKKPTLSEAYKHFTQKDLQNAHSAMADTVACMEVYFSLPTGETPCK